MFQQRQIEQRLAREVGLILMLLAFALVQITLLPRPLGLVPPLLLVVIISRALVTGASDGLRWSFYSGLALDLCAGTPLGSHALALLLGLVLVLVLVRRIRGEHWLIPIIAVFFSTLVYESVLALLYTWPGSSLEWRTYAAVVLLPSALLAVVPALPIYMALRQFAHWHQERTLEPSSL